MVATGFTATYTPQNTRDLPNLTYCIYVLYSVDKIELGWRHSRPRIDEASDNGPPLQLFATKTGLTCRRPHTRPASESKESIQDLLIKSTVPPPHCSIRRPFIKTLKTGSNNGLPSMNDGGWEEGCRWSLALGSTLALPLYSLAPSPVSLYARKQPPMLYILLYTTPYYTTVYTSPCCV